MGSRTQCYLAAVTFPSLPAAEAGTRFSDPGRIQGNHMPYGITQCYLPLGSGDFPAFTSAEAGTRFSDPEGCRLS